MTNSIDEIVNTDVVFVIGSNTTEAHPIVGLAIKKAIREKGAKLIIADPREIDLTRFAHIHMPQRPGSDTALLNGLLHVIFAEGLENREFIEARTENIEEARKAVEKYTPEFVEKLSGVPRERIVEAARLYAKAGKAMILWGMGITQHTQGVSNVLALANLALATGHIGKESTGLCPLRGQNNVQGACDMGALPDVYNGYQKVDNPAVKEKFEKGWGRPLPGKPGKTSTDMVNSMGKEGGIRFLYVMGENPLLSDADLKHARKGFEALDFLVVQDLFMTETAKLADVVLPGVSFAEKEGTFTNTERRVQRVRKGIEPLEGCKDDLSILVDISNRIGLPMNYSSAGDVLDELASLTPSYGGISFDRLNGLGLQWPCPTREHPGTPYLHKEGFPRGRGRFSPVDFLGAKESPDAEYPLIMTTGRGLFHYHTGTLSERVEDLNKVSPESVVEVNPVDAVLYGVAEGDMVKLRSRRGEVRIKARLTTRSPEGVVFVASLRGDVAINTLTQSSCDPVAKIPELKVTAVALSK